ncbi:MAG: glutamine synthetase type III, partial [Lentisphaeria bacterium]|nr:glutamine synthetase type III [Lentisphaeria bacterium]
EDQNVLSKVELLARREVDLENYILKLQIEARVLGDLCKSHIVPAAVKYQSILINNVKGMMDVMGAKDGKVYSGAQLEMIKELSGHIGDIKNGIDSMVKERKAANKIEENEDKAIAYCDKVKPYFDKLRYHTDKLEQIVSDDLWPLPKLRELLFTR